jgi:hypothetical protein
MKDTYLYCHTSYPDLGWDIPELLQQHELSSRVFFTYVCTETNKPFASLFKGARSQSPFTGNYCAVLSNVQSGLSYEDLAKVMNCFDLYVQYANSEGFGLPQVEAAACGVPVMATDYSAMSSVVRKLGGTPLPPKSLYKELETGCYRAVPDNVDAAFKMAAFLKSPEEDRQKLSKDIRKNFLKYYRWEDSGKKWEDYIDSVEITGDRWRETPLDIVKPADFDPKIFEKQTPATMTQWLIVNVLAKPEMMHSFLSQRLTRDLTFQNVAASVGGMYENEMSAMTFGGQNKREPFTIKNAYDHCRNIRNKINFWEDKRRKVFGI